jgi:hypothetical protein
MTEPPILVEIDFPLLAFEQAIGSILYSCSGFPKRSIEEMETKEKRLHRLINLMALHKGKRMRTLLSDASFTELPKILFFELVNSNRKLVIRSLNWKRWLM